MRTDAHIHMGYYTRHGYEYPFYYSPKRVIGLMDRCEIDEFIVSTTNAQIDCISIHNILREAEEMNRVANSRAHQFLWLSGRIYDSGQVPKLLDSGLYEGVKLHELETPWCQERTGDLVRILEQVEERGMKVQFHCSSMNGSRPSDLKFLAKRFVDIKFDFAHCRFKDNLIDVMEECENVYTDTGMFEDYAAIEMCSESIRSRIMYGSDFPAYHIFNGDGFTEEYRRRVRAVKEVCKNMDSAFFEFLK